MTQSSIKKVGVLGAGTMGSAIAQHFGMKGIEVVLVDQNAAAVERGVTLIRSSIDEATQRKVVTPEDAQKIISRIHGTTEFNRLSDCDLLVEAIFENLEVKREAFKKLEKIVKPSCILASNTSSFLISEIASHLENPKRLIGVHYFYHAAKNKLVEVIPSAHTPSEIAQQVWDFYESCGKTPIYTKDAPGFAVNRFFVPWLNEATRIYEEGYGSISFIDEIARDAFQIGMGPFALMNATGVPIAQHAAQGLADVLGKFYAPSEILKAQVSSQKTWDLNDTSIKKNGSNRAEVVRERLLGAALGVAAQLVHEKVADAASTDMGARVGLRWPKGPFEMIQEMGIAKAQEMITKFFKHWDLPVPSLNPNLEWISSTQVGKTGILTFNIPDRMNALNESVVSELNTKFTTLDSNPSIEKIILTGRGKAFVAGADVKFFVDCLEKNDIDHIYRFTEFGQKTLIKISNSKKVTLAYLNGLTLGGGLELALACKFRIASPSAMMAFPETGIGIFPGLGGTQRTPRLIGKGLAKYLVATGQMINADTALAFGLIQAIVPQPTSTRELALVSIPSSHSVAKSELEDAWTNYTGELGANAMSNPIIQKSEKALSRKAPIALHLAIDLIDRGSKESLERGLQLELDSLRKIFSTQDAKMGLSCLIRKQKPEYKGQ